MSLTGWAFPTLLVVLAVASFVAVVVLWPRLAGTGAVAIAARAGSLAGVSGMLLLVAAVLLNAQYLFFADWTDLAGALGGGRTAASVSRGGSAADAAGRAVPGGAVAGGRLPALAADAAHRGWLTYTVHGPASGLTGQIVVQLPPGYTAAANAATRYPVLETFPGYPGGVTQWVSAMNLEAAIAQRVAAHQMRPALIVSPAAELPPGVDTECVNGQPGFPQLETWLTADVPNWVVHTFRVRTDRASWATIGFSTGGWCAAMATVLHPGQYSAAIVLGGYFRPEFGPLYDPYPPKSRDGTRYDLVAVVAKAPPPVAIWLETSHSDAVSYGSSAAFLKVVRRPMAVSATVLQHAGHRIGLWRDLLPLSLTWLGRNIPGFKP